MTSLDGIHLSMAEVTIDVNNSTSWFKSVVSVISVSQEVLDIVLFSVS